MGCELEAHSVRVWKGEVIRLYCAHLVIDFATVAGLSLDAVRDRQLECHEDRPEAVVSHVRDAACAEIVPAAKHRIRIVGMIRTLDRWPQPEIPVEACRNRRCIGGKA